MASESPDNKGSNGDEDNERSENRTNVDPTRDPWESGLRRRRRDASRGNNNAESSDRRDYDTTAHHTNTTPGRFGGAAGSIPSNPSFNTGGACGNGSTAMLSTHSAAAGFGPSQSTPFKTPTKDSMLVPITPSTATISGETAESTIISSPRSHNRGCRPQSLRRQYQILENQIYLLLGSTSIGFILFLVFTLPFFALISLALMAVSLAALVPVASTTIRTRYQLEMEQPMGLLRYLPDSIRVLLTETTLHEYMSDTTFMMENRYLLLYFIPGIQPDQLMEYINQLPQRHRDALLQPGLGRFMPSLMNRLVRPDTFPRISDGDATDMLENEGRGDMSTSSLLTLDRDGHMNEQDTDREVTLIEAITSLRQTLNGQFNDAELPVIDENEEDADENSATPRGTQGNPNVARPSEVVVELPQTINSSADQNQQQSRQAEYDTEERILSDATSAAFTNYSTQATTMVSESAAGAVETVSSLIVRFGSWTGLLAGSGGIAMAAAFHPSSITLGLFNRPDADARIRTTDVGSSSNNRNGMMYGLFAASAFGFMSAGVSYFIRNRVRAAIANNREAEEIKSVECSEKSHSDVHSEKS
jgi:hypothetical protein